HSPSPAPPLVLRSRRAGAVPAPLYVRTARLAPVSLPGAGNRVGPFPDEGAGLDPRAVGVVPDRAEGSRGVGARDVQGGAERPVVGDGAGPPDGAVGAGAVGAAGGARRRNADGLLGGEQDEEVPEPVALPREGTRAVLPPEGRGGQLAHRLPRLARFLLER